MNKMTGNNKKGMWKNFEAIILQLKKQSEARSTELKETNKNGKSEKDMLLSQIVAAEKKTAEISRSSQMAQEAFNAEKESLLGIFFQFLLFKIRKFAIAALASSRTL